MLASHMLNCVVLNSFYEDILAVLKPLPSPCRSLVAAHQNLMMKGLVVSVMVVQSQLVKQLDDVAAVLAGYHILNTAPGSSVYSSTMLTPAVAVVPAGYHIQDTVPGSSVYSSTMLTPAVVAVLSWLETDIQPAISKVPMCQCMEADTADNPKPCLL